MLIEISLLGPSAQGRPSPTSIKTGGTPVTPLRGGKGGQRVVRGGPTILSGWAVGLSAQAKMKR